MSEEEGEDELVTQLKRVESDLTFRRRVRRRGLVIAVVVTFDLIVSVLSVAAFVGVHHQQDRSDADRQERSRGSCVQFNINQSNTREAIVVGLVETFRPFITPGRESDLDSFSASLRVNVERQLPYRDCSDAGIDKFLKDPPQDPNTGG